MRCAPHILHSVATVDANMALGSVSFVSAYRKGMSKAQGLWNLQSRSTVVANSIVNMLNRRSLLTCSTVMSNFAKALDKILGEEQESSANCIGYRHEYTKRLLYCSPLVDAILPGITKRLGLLLEDQEGQLAVAIHPKSCLFWLEQFMNRSAES
ncbi:hypothetical protein GOODEAATRI_017420 [Goodea atripinnis]|uniref:Uncharacterized protein n=1 Tax=Goodea atripinnis TaxID=208336 RepID=A0ABV0NCQ4_9TELE